MLLLLLLLLLLLPLMMTTMMMCASRTDSRHLFAVLAAGWEPSYGSVQLAQRLERACVPLVPLAACRDYFLQSGQSRPSRCRGRCRRRGADGGSRRLLPIPALREGTPARRYAGEKDALVFNVRPPPLLLASPTCSVPSTITARLAAPVLPRWPGFFGTAGLRLMLVVVVVVIGGSAAGPPSQTAGGVGPRGASLPLFGPVRLFSYFTGLTAGQSALGGGSGADPRHRVQWSQQPGLGLGDRNGNCRPRAFAFAFAVAFAADGGTRRKYERREVH